MANQGKLIGGKIYIGDKPNAVKQDGSASKKARNSMAGQKDSPSVEWQDCVRLKKNTKRYGKLFQKVPSCILDLYPCTGARNLVEKPELVSHGKKGEGTAKRS